MAGIKPLYAINSLKEGTIEQEWDGLSIDEKKNILDAALINPAEADYKDFASFCICSFRLLWRPRNVLNKEFEGSVIGTPL